MSGATGRELYVYYRVPLAAADQVRAEVASMRALLRCSSSISSFRFLLSREMF